MQLKKDESKIGEYITIDFLQKMLYNLIEKEKCSLYTKLSFEFILASCFPKAYENMTELLKQEYRRGFEDGYGIKINWENNNE